MLKMRWAIWADRWRWAGAWQAVGLRGMRFGRRPPGRSTLCKAMMRRTAALLLRHGGGGRGGGVRQALSDVLVCPLSKKPLRYCEASGSLVSDAVGVSFPIVDGIPCLVPKDGKLLEDHQEKSEECGPGDSSMTSEK